MMDANYYVEKRLVPPKRFWEWCFSLMPTYVWKNKVKTIVASKRKHTYCIEKRLTKASKLTFYDTKRHFQIILCNSKKIEIQTYAVYSEFVNGIQVFSKKLENMEILTNDQHVKVGGTLHENEYKFGLKQLNGMFNYYLPDLFEEENVRKKLKKSELRYLNLDDIAIDDLPRIYKYRERIEFCQKIRADRLAKHITWPSELDMRVVTMNFLKRNKAFFRNSNRTFSDYLLKQAIESKGIRFVPGIEKYMNYSSIREVPDFIGLLKLQNYLIKQRCAFSYYMDYIGILDSLKVSDKDKIKFPSNLILSHDRAVDAFNAVKHDIERQEFESRKRLEKSMEMEIGTFKFLLPATAEELVQEGKTLHHCVGGSGYIQKHAEGKTTIVFIRKNFKEPFYTMEYKDGKVAQVRGESNKDAFPELTDAVKKWEAAIKKNTSKKGV